MTPHDHERLAVAESHIATILANQQIVLQHLNELRNELTRYKGFLGGCIFLLTCLWTALYTFKDVYIGGWKGGID